MKTNHQRQFKASYRQYGGSPMGSTGCISLLADKVVGASWGGDNSNGHRGIAKAKRGAKKFVRSRIRFAEKLAIHAKLRRGHFEVE
jgi:hypothetical protein